MANTLPGEGCAISYSTDDTTYTDIPGVEDISGPSMTVDSVEKTVLADTHKRKRPLLQPDSGQITLKLQYDPDEASHAQLQTWADTPASTNPYWKITFTDGTPTTYKGQGFVTSFNPNGMAIGGNNVMADVTIELDGGITVA